MQLTAFVFTIYFPVQQIHKKYHSKIVSHLIFKMKVLYLALYLAVTICTRGNRIPRGFSESCLTVLPGAYGREAYIETNSIISTSVEFGIKKYLASRHCFKTRKELPTGWEPLV
jgi:hypothetical protein